MRFIINSQLLLENLQSLSSLLVENKALPILDKCLFKVVGNTLTLIAYDSETVAVVDINLDDVTGEGSIAVPAKPLMEALKTIPDIPMVFEIDLAVSGISFSAGNGNFKLVGESADMYPEIPQMSTDEEVANIASDVLVRAISKTIFATGNDQFRPAMCGVFFDFKPDSLTFVATDAYKLVRYRRTDFTASREVSFSVPKKALMLLKTMLSVRKDKLAVSVDANDKNVFFSFENVHISCRLIDGKYPNYEAVIPQDNPNKLFIPRQSFLNCIRRVCVFASKAIPKARLSMSGASEIMVSAEDVDNATAAKDRLTCQYEGQPMEIGFNAKFYLEMLSNVETEDVCLEMSVPSRAALLLPVGNENNNEDILMLVMPVML